jgi:hypothetical protein
MYLSWWVLWVAEDPDNKDPVLWLLKALEVPGDPVSVRNLFMDMSESGCWLSW